MEGTLLIIEILTDLVYVHRRICCEDVECGRRNSGPSSCVCPYPQNL